MNELIEIRQRITGREISKTERKWAEEVLDPDVIQPVCGESVLVRDRRARGAK